MVPVVWKLLYKLFVFYLDPIRIYFPQSDFYHKYQEHQNTERSKISFVDNARWETEVPESRYITKRMPVSESKLGTGLRNLFEAKSHRETNSKDDFSLFFFEDVHEPKRQLSPGGTECAEEQQSSLKADTSHATLVQSSNSKSFYHSKMAEFVHSDIALKSIPTKIPDHSVFAMDSISFGTILSAEYPVINTDSKSGLDLFEGMTHIDHIVKDQSENDAEFKRFWENIRIYQPAKDPYTEHLRSGQKPNHDPMVDNYSRFGELKIPSKKWLAYSVIGRVRFNLRPNVMVVISGKEKGYKAVMIATRNIEKGEEIVKDLCLNWNIQSLLQGAKLSLLQGADGRYTVSCKERYFYLNEEWMKRIKQFQDPKISKEQRHEIMFQIYPNGLIGKSPESEFEELDGCHEMNLEDCYKKMTLSEVIKSGKIFDRIWTQKDAKLTVLAEAAQMIPQQWKDNIANKVDNLVERNRAAFHYDEDSANDRQLMTHPIYTQFVHSALKLKYFGDEKQYGLITTERIPFGTVLVVERPMLQILSDTNVDIDDMASYVATVLPRQLRTDEHFKRIWREEFRANEDTFGGLVFRFLTNEMELPSDEVLVDLAKLSSRRIDGADLVTSLNRLRPVTIFSVLSRINHGIPQNVAALYGEKKDHSVCMLIATRDLEKGEEVTLSYYQDLHLKKSLLAEYKQEKNIRGSYFGFQWSDALESMIKILHSDEATGKQKRRIIHDRLYSNGIIGKQRGEKFKMIKGCDREWMTETQCDTKKKMKEDFENGKLFGSIQARNSPAEWMGNEFVKYYVANKERNEK